MRPPVVTYSLDVVLLASVDGRKSTVQDALEELVVVVLGDDEAADGGGIKVGIVETRDEREGEGIRVSSESATVSGTIGGVEFDGLLEGQEVTGRLGHLLVIELEDGRSGLEAYKKVTVAEIASRHLGEVVPDGGVVVETEGKVVLDEILSGDTEIEGVPVAELLSHDGELLLRNGHDRGIVVLVHRVGRNRHTLLRKM